MNRTISPTRGVGAARSNGSRSSVGTDGTEAKPRRRPPPLLVGLGIAVVAFGAFVWLTPAQPRSLPVLVVRSPVAQGSVINQADLGVVTLAAPKGLAVLRAADEAGVVGSHAVVTLSPGELVSSADYSTVSSKQVSVGLALRAGQFPDDLAPGMQVAVLLAGSKTSAPTILAGDASVTSVSASVGSPDGELVTLGVNANQAGPVALASAAGNVVLVVLP